MTHRQIIQPRARCCPMCDNLGFKRLNDYLAPEMRLQCNSCEHVWTAHYGGATDKRRTLTYGDSA